MSYMARFNKTAVISQRYLKALNYSAFLHSAQTRWDGTPFLSHLLQVSSICLQVGSEDAAIAALFCHTLEDLPSVIDLESGFSHPIDAMSQSERFDPSISGVLLQALDSQPEILENSTWDPEREESIREALWRWIEIEWGNPVFTTVINITENQLLCFNPPLRRKEYIEAIKNGGEVGGTDIAIVSMADKYCEVMYKYAFAGHCLSSQKQLCEELMPVYRSKLAANIKALELIGRMENVLKELREVN